MSKRCAKVGINIKKAIAYCYYLEKLLYASGAEETFGTDIMKSYKIYAFKKYEWEDSLIFTLHLVFKAGKIPLSKMIFSVLLTYMSHCGMLLG